MKSLLMILVNLLIVIGYAHGQENIKNVSSKINKVTVFLNQAQIEREATVTIEPGKTVLVFEKLSPNIDVSSIQFNATGAAVIMGIQQKFNYLETATLTRKYKLLLDSSEVYKQQLYEIKDDLQVLQMEEALLVKNQQVYGTENGLSVVELQKMLIYYQSELKRIRKTKRVGAVDKRLVEARKNRLDAQIRELSRSKQTRYGEVEVTVTTKKATKLSTKLQYLVSGAGWEPRYDVRAKDTESPLKIEYKANVYQKTGIDWKDVKLSLSTSIPSVDSNKPVLSQQVVNVREPVQQVQYNNYKKAEKYARSPSIQESADSWGEEMIDEDMEPAFEEVVLTTSTYTTMSQTMLSSSFDISIPYTIPSDGKPQMVSVNDLEVPANFMYYIVPSVNEKAYLIAEVTDWEQYELFSGSMNIYLGGTFVGASYLNTDVLNDTLLFSLGVDDNISVNYETQNFKSTKFIGSNKKETKSYSISVKNAKATAVDIIIEGQIPTTGDSRVEVNLLSSDGAQHTTATGMLKWKLKLLPKDTKKLDVKYELKYPKDTKITY